MVSVGRICSYLFWQKKKKKKKRSEITELFILSLKVITIMSSAVKGIVQKFISCLLSWLTKYVLSSCVSTTIDR